MTIVQLLAPTGSVASRVPNGAADIVLTALQQKAVDQILRGENTIVHGAAGTGKSQVIAAVLHALGCKSTFSNTVAQYLQYNFDDYEVGRILSTKRLAQTQMIILDEYIMVSTDDMHNLNATLRHYLDPNKLFGGMQLVLLGDTGQLPPVSHDLFAQSVLFHAFDVSPIVLDQIMRQDAAVDGNDDFINFLTRLRTDTMDVNATCLLDYYLHRQPRTPFLGACATRSAMFAGNQAVVSKAKGTHYLIAKSVKKYEKDLMSTLLHVGAPVQLTKNIYDDDGSLLYYNGQFGVCSRVEGIYKEVSTDFGPVYLMKPKTTRVSVVINDIELEVSHVECAYYTTIHRLQGLTLTCNLHVDLTGAPKETVRALAYVAFSRVKHFSQLSTSLSSFDMEEW